MAVKSKTILSYMINFVWNQLTCTDVQIYMYVINKSISQNWPFRFNRKSHELLVNSFTFLSRFSWCLAHVRLASCMKYSNAQADRQHRIQFYAKNAWPTCTIFCFYSMASVFFFLSTRSLGLIHPCIYRVWWTTSGWIHAHMTLHMCIRCELK